MESTQRWESCCAAGTDWHLEPLESRKTPAVQELPSIGVLEHAEAGELLDIGSRKDFRATG
jgi:hypothetical protein